MVVSILSRIAAAAIRVCAIVVSALTPSIFEVKGSRLVAWGASWHLGKETVVVKTEMCSMSFLSGEIICCRVYAKWGSNQNKPDLSTTWHVRAHCSLCL